MSKEYPYENATDSTEEADIFLLHENQQYGPYTKSQLIQHISDGSVTIGTMAKRSTMPNWLALWEWREFQDACLLQKPFVDEEPVERVQIRSRIAGSTILSPDIDGLGANVKEIKRDSALMFLVAIAWILGDHLPESGASWNIPTELTIALHISLGGIWIICGYALFNCHLDKKSKHVAGLGLPFIAWIFGTISSDPVFYFLFAPGHSYNPVVAIPSLLFLLLVWLIPFIYLPFASDTLLHKTIHTCRKLHAFKGRAKELWSASANCTMCFITVLLVSCDAFDVTTVIAKSITVNFVFVRIILFVATIAYRQFRYSQLEQYE